VLQVHGLPKSKIVFNCTLYKHVCTVCEWQLKPEALFNFQRRPPPLFPSLCRYSIVSGQQRPRLSLARWSPLVFVPVGALSINLSHALVSPRSFQFTTHTHQSTIVSNSIYTALYVTRMFLSFSPHILRTYNHFTHPGMGWRISP